MSERVKVSFLVGLPPVMIIIMITSTQLRRKIMDGEVTHRDLGRAFGVLLLLFLLFLLVSLVSLDSHLICNSMVTKGTAASLFFSLLALRVSSNSHYKNYIENGSDREGREKK